MAAVLRRAFRSEGYEVVQVATPRAAAELESAGTIDLIVTGSFSRTVEDALDCINELDGCAAAPIVLFTDQPVDEDVALAFGFSAVIEKPYDVSGLTETARKLLLESQVS